LKKNVYPVQYQSKIRFNEQVNIEVYFDSYSLMSKKKSYETTIDCHFGWAMNIDHLSICSNARTLREPPVKMMAYARALIVRLYSQDTFDLHAWIQWTFLFFF